MYDIKNLNTYEIEVMKNIYDKKIYDYDNNLFCSLVEKGFLEFKSGKYKVVMEKEIFYEMLMEVLSIPDEQQFDDFLTYE